MSLIDRVLGKWEISPVESFEAMTVLTRWLFFFTGGLVSVHVCGGGWVKAQSALHPAPESHRRDKQKPALHYEFTGVFRQQHFWLFNTSLLLFFFLLSLNAGISKDAGPDRLMACLEQSKTQPASLSLLGTGAKTKNFPSPKEPCKHIRSGFFYFTGTGTVDASPLGNISCICTLVL